MQEFPVNWLIKNSKNMNGFCYELKLNDEWAILISPSPDFVGFIYNSIIIRRKNTAGEILVSGNLSCERGRTPLFEKYFSQLIKTGSSTAYIYLDTSLGRLEGFETIRGFVKISEINETSPSNLSNTESMEAIPLRSLEKLSKDLQQILDPSSSFFSDVTLKCGSVSIPAHKIILSARSQVFSAMFATPMKENRKNEVDITDISESTLRALMMYIYSGKTPDLTASSAADLLFGADKYQLQELITVCSDFLKDTVSSKNVLRILVLGDRHDENLKSFAMEYICNKCEFSVLEKTQEWITLRRERPDLAIALLEYLVKFREGKQKR